MQVSGDEITTETLTFGEYVDYSVSVYADDADSLITHTQGTIGVDVELPTLIIEEDVVNSWLINRNTEIEFPSWIKIKNIVVEDETTNIVNSKGIPFSENDLYWDAGDTSIEIDDLAPASWDVMEMHLTFTVDIDANAPLGEIDVLLSGHALYPDFLVRLGQVVDNEWGGEEERATFNSTLDDETVIPGFKFTSEHMNFYSFV